MAYTINKTDGTVVTTITDGTVDNTTSLQLFGQSYSGFGEGSQREPSQTVRERRFDRGTHSTTER
jgi:hypothetical protein